MQDLSGTQIDRYSIEAEIGHGGMSRVYRAHHPGLGRDVALKVLLPEIAGDEVSVTRFLREARAAAKLDHPNIVPIYDTGQDGGSYFIAMRLIEGRTLRAVLGERSLSLAEVSRYLTQIASALDYAHARGIVHRDIKPENMMVDATGTVTLTDFGIANLADEMSVTATGAVIGTPVYMAPEHLRGEAATPRSDIYGLGVLAYELLSGSSPFAGRTPYAVMLAQIDEQPEPVHHRRGDVPVEASRVIDRALEKDPALRYATAGEFARQFVGALGEQREARPAGLAVPAPRLSGTGSVTIKSTITPMASRAVSAPTLVPGSTAPTSSPPLWRGPWFAGLLGAGLLLAVMFAGVSAFRDSQDSVAGQENPAFLPVIGTPTPGATPEPTSAPSPENSPEPDDAVPVAHPAGGELVEGDPPLPTETVEIVEEPTPVEPTPVEVVEEQPTAEPAPAQEVVEEQPAVEPVPVQDVVEEQPAVEPAPAEEVAEEQPVIEPAPAEEAEDQPAGPPPDDDGDEPAQPQRQEGNPEKPNKEKPDKPDKPEKSDNSEEDEKEEKNKKKDKEQKEGHDDDGDDDDEDDD